MAPKTAWSTTPTLPLVILLAFAASLTVYNLAKAGPQPTTAATIAASPILPQTLLLALRMGSAALVWHALIGRVTSKMGSFIAEVARFPSSRLRPTSVVMGGPIVLLTFTVQCWTLQGLYFTGAAVVSASQLALLPAIDASLPSLPRVCQVLFEVAFACALLTSCVVTFFLIPGNLKRGQTPLLFFRNHQQLMHCANLYLMLNELLFNAIPIVPADFWYVLLFALFYLALAWTFCQISSIVYYPFIDPTLPPKLAIPIYLGLVVILGAFYSLGCGLQAAHSMEMLLPTYGRILCVYLGASRLVWTRWKGVPLPPDGTKHLSWAEASIQCKALERPVSEGWKYLR